LAALRTINPLLIQPLAFLLLAYWRALLAVDPRFPRLTMPRFAGLILGPGATQSLSFSLAVPAGVERRNCLGNAILFQSNWHDVGKYLDRGIFAFEVT
jgi:hypothetical protein